MWTNLCIHDQLTRGERGGGSLINVERGGVLLLDQI